jgi:hypothetical protein
MDDIHKHKFIYFVKERDNIRFLKDELGAPKPWSIDPVFQRTYFCNIDREQDRVTKWIRDVFIPEYMEHSAANMMMARFVNKPDSLLLLGWPWTYFAEPTWRYEMSQPGAWGSAYIVSTNGRAMPKHEYIAGLLEQAFEQLAGWPGAGPQPTLASAHRHLQALQSMGAFMAAQVVADLKNTKGHPLQHAPDWNTWSSHGPGSLRGLEWFHGRRITPSTYQEAIASARAWVYNVDSTLLEALCNQNLQNCFCEYDKYMRVSSGTGRSKRRYNGS